jgi:hypothetical protein
MERFCLLYLTLEWVPVDRGKHPHGKHAGQLERESHVLTTLAWYCIYVSSESLSGIDTVRPARP